MIAVCSHFNGNSDRGAPDFLIEALRSAYSGLTHQGHHMTDEAYITAYRKIADKYENNQSSMEDYLEAMKKLKETFLKDRAGATLPVTQ